MPLEYRHSLIKDSVLCIAVVFY